MELSFLASLPPPCPAVLQSLNDQETNFWPLLHTWLPRQTILKQSAVYSVFHVAHPLCLISSTQTSSLAPTPFPPLSTNALASNLYKERRAPHHPKPTFCCLPFPAVTPVIIQGNPFRADPLWPEIWRALLSHIVTPSAVSSSLRLPLFTSMAFPLLLQLKPHFALPLA